MLWGLEQIFIIIFLTVCMVYNRFRKLSVSFSGLKNNQKNKTWNSIFWATFFSDTASKQIMLSKKILAKKRDNNTLTLYSSM